MTDDPLVRVYLPGKNPDEAALPGVPLRSLTKSEFAALPDWLQQSVDASGFWRVHESKPADNEEKASAATKPASQHMTAPASTAGDRT